MTTVLVGGGPAAAGLLMAAERAGLLGRLLGDGLTVIHAGSAAVFGAGRLGGYLVRSDTRARVFAECAAPTLGGRDTPEGLLLRCGTDEPVRLDVAAALLAAAGRQVLDRVRARPGATVLSETEVVSLNASGPGLLLRVAGRPSVRADRAVLAVGGLPWMPPGMPGDSRMVLHSDDALVEAGYRRLLARLTGASPRATVVGGSHSAFAVAGLLLRAPVRWGRGAITIAHRGEVRVTYPDAAAARADGVPVYPCRVCPMTGVVDRFGGLRSDAADLYQRIRRGTETRVRMVRVPGGWDWFPRVARDDPVVVAATGYTSAVTRLFGGGWWDGDGRLRASAGGVVPRVYGLGLGTRRPRGPRTGGEEAFRGAIDGVWFYQHVVAPDLLSLVLSDCAPG